MYPVSLYYFHGGGYLLAETVWYIYCMILVFTYEIDKLEAISNRTTMQIYN